MNNNVLDTSRIFESRIRIQMVASLSVDDLTYTQLKRVCRCTDGNMTTHTKKLIDSGFVTVKKEFIDNKPCTTYHLTEKGKEEFENYVKILNQLVNHDE